VSDLAPRAAAWMADDPDEGDRAELGRLLRDAGDDSRAASELADRFADRLRFGTAGLRGAVGAGPNRMNRAVVRATTAALARYLAKNQPGASRAGVVVCCDARHRSSELADETTAVLAGAGFIVHRLADRQPTPLLAFAVPLLTAAAGVMITASHNPPRDNGYKLYLGDGAQIVPPVDGEIEALIGGVGPLGLVPLGDLSGPLVVRHGDEVADAYLSAVTAVSPRDPAAAVALKVVYTPMHGVARRLFLEALERAGYPAPVVVAEQAEPDPDFPTVAFPNPEEPGALDLAFATARREGADLVLANDPDGDRLAVAVPDEDAPARWRRLSGDEVGALLGSYVLGRPHPEPAVVASSVVSSSMLEKLASAAGVPFVATLTGFKWIVRAPDAVPGSRLVFGYEEALGYGVGDVVRDKDGIGAALSFLGLASDLAASGSSVSERLDELAARFGVHRTVQLTVPTSEPERTMERLRSSPPACIGSDEIVETVDFANGERWQPGLPALPPADMLAYRLSSGARLLVRPSGTEPKLKAYLEVVRSAEPGRLAEARSEADRRLALLEEGVRSLVGTG
jgi:phosphomannomutase